METNETKIKYYRRKIDCGKGLQEIIVIDGEFAGIETFSLYGGYYVGCEPREYDLNAKMPRGFLTKYGFKEFEPRY